MAWVIEAGMNKQAARESRISDCRGSGPAYGGRMGLFRTQEFLIASFDHDDFRIGRLRRKRLSQAGRPADID